MSQSRKPKPRPPAQPSQAQKARRRKPGEAEWEQEKANAREAGVAAMAHSVTFEQMLLADAIAEQTVNAGGDPVEHDAFARRDFIDAEPKAEVTPNAPPLDADSASVKDVRRGLRASSDVVVNALKALEQARAEQHKWAQRAVQLKLPAQDVADLARVKRKTVYEWRKWWG